jgi:tetratricopeptide (TPR) repeat protein
MNDGTWYRVASKELELKTAKRRALELYYEATIKGQNNLPLNGMIMELTLEEVLHKAVKAHKAGQVQEADRLYTAILKAQPKHPDTNHNMGVLAVSAGKLQEALPFFKTALEVNPSLGQYWLSYIDVLIKLNRIADAKAVFEQVKDQVVSGEAFDQLGQLLADRGLTANGANVMETAGSSSSQSNILDTTTLDKALRLAQRKSKDGMREEAMSTYQDILQKFPKNKKAQIALQLLTGQAVSAPQDPPIEKLQPILDLYSQGQLQQTLFNLSQMLKIFPNSSTLYNIAGACHFRLMQFGEALNSYKQSLKIKPDNAEAYNNMGKILSDKGDLDAAIDSFKHALVLKPDYAQAHANLGLLFLGLC